MDADLKSYFDTIPHGGRLALVKERVVDGRVLALVEQSLKAGVLEALKGWQPTERGPPSPGGNSYFWRTGLRGMGEKAGKVGGAEESRTPDPHNAIVRLMCLFIGVLRFSTSRYRIDTGCSTVK